MTINKRTDGMTKADRETLKQAHFGSRNEEKQTPKKMTNEEFKAWFFGNVAR